MKKLVSDELRAEIEPLLPKHKACAKGGRPLADDRAALTGIMFVLRTGIPWQDLPVEMGLRVRLDVLATAHGVATQRRVGEIASALARAARACRKDVLEPGPSRHEKPSGKKGASTLGRT